MLGYPHIVEAHSTLDDKIAMGGDGVVRVDDQQDKMREIFASYGVSHADVMKVSNEYTEGFIISALPLFIQALATNPADALAGMVQSAYVQGFLVAVAATNIVNSNQEA